MMGHAASRKLTSRAALAAENDLVDLAASESFPASDAPGWIGVRVGAARQAASTESAEIIDLQTPRHGLAPAEAPGPEAPPRCRPSAHIYRPARSVMQAGQARTKCWVLEFEPVPASEVEPLMGWTSSSDMWRQVRLSFPTREQACAFAKRQGWDYTVSEPHEPRLRPKSYADNFRWRLRPQALPAKARRGGG